jgi:hypothetical protein
MKFFFHLCQKKTKGDWAKGVAGSNVANTTTTTVKLKK